MIQEAALIFIRLDRACGLDYGFTNIHTLQRYFRAFMIKKFCTLQKRRQFLKVSGAGKRFYGEHFLVQALPNPEISGIFRVGYVATRKTGNAVKRNKAKRRLRSLVYLFQDRFDFGSDYVFVARSSLWSVNFEILQNDFESVLVKVAKMDKSANQSVIDGGSVSVSTNC